MTERKQADNNYLAMVLEDINGKIDLLIEMVRHLDETKADKSTVQDLRDDLHRHIRSSDTSFRRVNGSLHDLSKL